MSTLQIEERITVNAPARRVWRFMLDPARVAACLPGAKLDGTEGDSTYLGTMKVKVGPVLMEIKGKATMSDIDPVERRVTMSGTGNDKAGGGSARMDMKSQVLEKDGGSEIVVTAEVHLAGKLVRFGRGMMEGISKQLFKQFAERVHTALDQDDDDEEDQEEEAPDDTGSAGPSSKPDAPVSPEADREAAARPPEKTSPPATTDAATPAEKASTDSAEKAPEKASSDSAEKAPEKASTDSAEKAPEKASSDSAEKAPTDSTSGEKASAEKASTEPAEEASTDSTSTAEKATSVSDEKPTSGKPAADAHEKATTDAASSEKASSDSDAPDKAPPAKTASEEPGEKPSSEKASSAGTAKESASDKASPGKPKSRAQSHAVSTMAATPAAIRKKKSPSKKAIVPVEDNAPLDAGSLVWSAIWAWFKGLFARLFGKSKE